MLRNVWTKVSSDWDTKKFLRKQGQCIDPTEHIAEVDHNKTIISVNANRDSGIFEDFSNFSLSEEEQEKEDYFIPDLDLCEEEKEDYFIPDLDLCEEDKEDYFIPDLNLCEQEKGDYFQTDLDISEEDYLHPGIFIAEEDTASYFIHDTDPCSDCDVNSSDEELGSNCDSDRELHASLSSLATAVGGSISVSISLSSLTTSTDEEEQEGASDFDFSSSDSEDDLSEDNSDTSKSFGYHSLLNDLSPDEDLILNFNLHRKQKASGNDKEIINSEVSSVSHFEDKSKVFAINSASPALSFYDNYPFNSYSRCDNSRSCSSLDSSDCSSSSGEEDPSDIELKMAETEVKMCDALLSSGREDLSTRSSMKYQNGDVRSMVDSTKSIKQLHTNDFKPPNNNYPVDVDNEKKVSFRLTTEMRLPLESNNRGGQTPSLSDNRRNSSSLDSPIIDAYEKECCDAPEKIVKEMENKERELENKQRTLRNKQKELELELQELENKQQALIDKKKRESEERIAEELSEMDVEHDQDMLAFEAVMKRAIKNKEAVSHNTPPMTLDLIDDLGMRHRPSPQQRRRERNALRRNPTSAQKLGRLIATSHEEGEFDVYTMETSLPKIDWETIEEHFRISQEEEDKWRRTDREEIRKKLAMGTDDDEEGDSYTKKPSLQSRLQNGRNLQICFMNETASDCESQCSDTESTQDRIDEVEPSKDSKEKVLEPKDFLTHQAKLREEARLALAQAKEMARMQMQLEKLNQIKSPITDIVRGSFNKIGFPCPANKRRMSRQVLSDMNVAQLQVIVNEFHTQIENLNEVLVQLLLQRDDLHMEQDSMLVDIEDLNKHLGAKEGCLLLTLDNKSSKNSRPKRSLKSSKLRPYVNK